MKIDDALIKENARLRKYLWRLLKATWKSNAGGSLDDIIEGALVDLEDQSFIRFQFGDPPLGVSVCAMGRNTNNYKFYVGRAQNPDPDQMPMFNDDYDGKFMDGIVRHPIGGFIGYYVLPELESTHEEN